MKFEQLKAGPAVGNEDYHFFRRIGMAVLAGVVFLCAQMFVLAAVGIEHWNTLWLMSSQGIAALALMFMALVQFRSAGAIRALAGQNLASSLKVFLPLVVLAYVVCIGLDVGLGFPREAWMTTLFAGMSAPKVALCVLMTVTFPPIAEELLYRHFLFRIFPSNSRIWLWVAVIATSLLFTFTHSQYKHWPTFLLIGALAVILAVARLRTGGILVPVLLHSAAEVIGLSSDWALGQWG